MSLIHSDIYTRSSLAFSIRVCVLISRSIIATVACTHRGRVGGTGGRLAVGQVMVDVGSLETGHVVAGLRLIDICPHTHTHTHGRGHVAGDDRRALVCGLTSRSTSRLRVGVAGICECPLGRAAECGIAHSPDAASARCRSPAGLRRTTTPTLHYETRNSWQSPACSPPGANALA